VAIVHDDPQLRAKEVAAIIAGDVLDICELELCEKRYFRSDVLDFICMLDRAAEAGGIALCSIQVENLYCYKLLGIPVNPSGVSATAQVPDEEADPL
jgi:hypothetical protein